MTEAGSDTPSVRRLPSLEPYPRPMRICCIPVNSAGMYRRDPMFAVRAEKSLFDRTLTPPPLAFDDSVGGVSKGSAPLNDVAESLGNGYDSLARLTLGSYELTVALCWAAGEEFEPGVSPIREGIVWGSTSDRE
jgi:hypothetical protein